MCWLVDVYEVAKPAHLPSPSATHYGSQCNGFRAQALTVLMAEESRIPPAS